MLIFSRYQVLWTSDCHDAYMREGLLPVVCQELKRAMAGTPPYQVLYKDDSIEVVRRESAPTAPH